MLSHVLGYDKDTPAYLQKNVVVGSKEGDEHLV